MLKNSNYSVTGADTRSHADNRTGQIWPAHMVLYLLCTVYLKNKSNKNVKIHSPFCVATPGVELLFDCACLWDLHFHGSIIFIIWGGRGVHIMQWNLHIIVSHRLFLYQIREFHGCENVVCTALGSDTVQEAFNDNDSHRHFFIRHNEASTSVLLMEIKL